MLNFNHLDEGLDINNSESEKENPILSAPRLSQLIREGLANFGIKRFALTAGLVLSITGGTFVMESQNTQAAPQLQVRQYLPLVIDGEYPARRWTQPIGEVVINP